MNSDTNTKLIRSSLLKTKNYILINECYPCEILSIKEFTERDDDVSKLDIWGINIFTRKLHQTICSPYMSVKSPIVTNKYHLLGDVNDYGFTLFDDDGHIITATALADVNHKIRNIFNSNRKKIFIVKVMRWMENYRIIDFFNMRLCDNMIQHLCNNQQVSYFFYGLINAIMTKNHDEADDIINRLDLKHHNFLIYRIINKLHDKLGDKSLCQVIRSKILNRIWHEKLAFSSQINSLIGYDTDIPKTIYHYSQSLF